MTATAKVGFTLLASDMQGDYTVLNSALYRLDALLGGVADKDATIQTGLDIDGTAYIVGETIYSITAISIALHKFTIAGNQTADIHANETLRIVGGAGSNDGTYTIYSVTLVGGATEIVVNEDINSATIQGSVHHARGDWNGYGLYIAHYYGSSWHFYSIAAGGTIFVNDETKWYYRTAAGWTIYPDAT